MTALFTLLMLTLPASATELTTDAFGAAIRSLGKDVAKGQAEPAEALSRANALVEGLNELTGVVPRRELADLWFLLGVTAHRQGNAELAREGFATACGVEPSYRNRSIVADDDEGVLATWRASCGQLPRTATLEVSGAPDGSRLYVDSDSLDNPVYQGRHLVQLIGESHPPDSRLITVGPTETVRINFDLQVSPTPPPQGTTIELPVADLSAQNGMAPPQDRGAPVAWFVAGGVLAAASAGLAIATAVHWETSVDEARTWNDPARFEQAADTHRILQSSAFVTGGAGLASLGIGIAVSF